LDARNKSGHDEGHLAQHEISRRAQSPRGREGCAERPKAASVAQSGQPYGRPARGDIEARSRLPSRAKAADRGPPRPDRVTPDAGTACSLVSGRVYRAFLGRRSPTPHDKDGPRHASLTGRDGWSLMQARGPGITCAEKTRGLENLSFAVGISLTEPRRRTPSCLTNALRNAPAGLE
jgi:hypothetical protein